jgi:hypothetical protein
MEYLKDAKKRRDTLYNRKRGLIKSVSRCVKHLTFTVVGNSIIEHDADLPAVKCDKHFLGSALDFLPFVF